METGNITEHSKVKRVLAFAAAVLVLAAAVYFAVYLITYDKPEDSVLGESAAYIEQLKAGGYQIPTSTLSCAQSGASGQERNSLLSVKAGLNSGADCVQLNISFASDGTAVLADSFDEITENSVPLRVAVETVLNSEINPNAKMIFNIMEASHMESISSLLMEFNLYDRVILTGLNSENYDYLINYIMELPYFYDISAEDAQDKETFLKQVAFAEELSASGISVSINDIDAEKVAAFHEVSSLLIFVYDADSADALYKAATLPVDIIGSVEPKALEQFFNVLK